MQLRSTQIAENKESVKNKQERTEVVGRGGDVRNEVNLMPSGLLIKEKKRKRKVQTNELHFIYIFLVSHCLTASAESSQICPQKRNMSSETLYPRSSLKELFMEAVAMSMNYIQGEYQQKYFNGLPLKVGTMAQCIGTMN